MLKAGSSSWNDFFWKIRVPGKYKKYKFWENVVHGNRKAFLAMDPQVIKGIWNVSMLDDATRIRDIYNIYDVFDMV